MPRRILALTTMLPYPPTNGLQMRTWQTLQGLASVDCEINLLSLGQPAERNGHIGEIHRVCKTIESISHLWTNVSQNSNYCARLRALPSSLPYSVARFRSKAMQEQILQWVHSGSIDALLSDTIYPLVNSPPELPIPVIVNCHNIEHLILQRYLQCERNPLRRAYARIEHLKLERFEQQSCSRASLLLVCSEYDASVLQKLCPGPPIAVVPNAVDTLRYFPSLQSDKGQHENGTVLYTGGMDWFPNRDAVEFFVTKILPDLRRSNPHTTFVVAGRPGPEKFQRWLAGIPNVEFHGPVPDMRAEIARAAICVVPLRIGSGTRLKILEAAAMGKPIVSTSVGAEGLEFHEPAEIILADDPGEEIILADEPSEFARAIHRLLADSDRCRTLGLAARRRVEEQYSMPVMRTAVHQALSHLSIRT